MDDLFDDSLEKHLALFENIKRTNMLFKNIEKNKWF